MVKIISDSTCDLGSQLTERYGIEIIPLRIILGDRDLKDGIDITPAEIYAWSDEHRTTPKTAAVSPADARECMKRHLDSGDDIIVFTISAQMSTTFNIFKMEAEELDPEGKRIRIIDSMNLSTGIGLLVIEAAEMAMKGCGIDEIETQVKKLIPLVRSSFIVDTLEYLYRGGRCSGVSAFLGSRLKLHPKIIVSGGAMEPSKKYRGKMNKVLSRYVSDMEEKLLAARPERVFITDSGASPKTVTEIREYLKRLNHFDEILETTAGGVISSHCGPGTLGVLYIKEE